jgi:hypothetical protein
VPVTPPKNQLFVIRAHKTLLPTLHSRSHLTLVVKRQRAGPTNAQKTLDESRSIHKLKGKQIQCHARSIVERQKFAKAKTKNEYTQFEAKRAEARTRNANFAGFAGNAMLT